MRPIPTKSKILLSATVLALGLGAALPQRPAGAQSASRTVQPERSLLGIRLGRPFMDVLRAFKQPNEVQTVAMAVPTDQLPGLGGAGAFGGAGMEGAGMMGGGGTGMMMPGMMGGGGGNGPGGGGMGAPGMAFGGGSPFGNSMMGGGAPGLPGVGGPGMPGMMGSGPGMPGMMGSGPGMPGMMGSGPEGAGMEGMMGAPGMEGMMGGYGGSSNVPEYSTAILWIYKRPNDLRYEFLINEDGRVAQISVAAPAAKAKAITKASVPIRTSRGVTLGSPLHQVMQAYGNPERHRMLPGLRFYELYYTKKNHAAITMDTQKGMKVVRITVALAD